MSPNKTADNNVTNSDNDNNCFDKIDDRSLSSVGIGDVFTSPLLPFIAPSSSSSSSHASNSIRWELTGIIKSQPEDFIVKEISMDGQVADIVTFPTTSTNKDESLKLTKETGGDDDNGGGNDRSSSSQRRRRSQDDDDYDGDEKNEETRDIKKPRLLSPLPSQIKSGSLQTLTRDGESNDSSIITTTHPKDDMTNKERNVKGDDDNIETKTINSQNGDNNIVVDDDDNKHDNNNRQQQQQQQSPPLDQLKQYLSGCSPQVLKSLKDLYSQALHRITTSTSSLTDTTAKKKSVDDDDGSGSVMIPEDMINNNGGDFKRGLFHKCITEVFPLLQSCTMPSSTTTVGATEETIATTKTDSPTTDESVTATSNDDDNDNMISMDSSNNRPITSPPSNDEHTTPSITSNTPTTTPKIIRVSIDDTFLPLSPYLSHPLEDLPPLYRFRNDGPLRCLQQRHGNNNNRGGGRGRRRGRNHRHNPRGPTDDNDDSSVVTLRLRSTIDKDDRRRLHRSLSTATHRRFQTSTRNDDSSNGDTPSSAIIVSWSAPSLRHATKKNNKNNKTNNNDNNNSTNMIHKCLLQKRKIEHLVAINILSRYLRLPPSSIGLAGIKDTMAITTQFVTLRCRNNFSQRQLTTISKRDLEPRGLTLVGLDDEKERFLNRGDLKGNRFVIALRGVRYRRVVVRDDDDGGRGGRDVVDDGTKREDEAEVEDVRSCRTSHGTLTRQ